MLRGYDLAVRQACGATGLLVLVDAGDRTDRKRGSPMRNIKAIV